jgi:hypothetical protein
MTWEKHIFEPGERYVAVKSFRSFESTFVINEELQFVKDYYSFHDNCFVYEFRSLQTGETKWWWLSESAVNEDWRTYFAPNAF